MSWPIKNIWSSRGVASIALTCSLAQPSYWFVRAGSCRTIIHVKWSKAARKLPTASANPLSQSSTKRIKTTLTYGASCGQRLWLRQIRRSRTARSMVTSPACLTSKLSRQRAHGVCGPIARLRALIHSCRFVTGGLHPTDITTATTATFGDILVGQAITGLTAEPSWATPEHGRVQLDLEELRHSRP